MHRPREHSRRAVLLAAVALTVAACGSGGEAASGSSDAADGETLSGVVRDPAPTVSGNPLPSLSSPGADVDFAAQPGGIKVVYFGFTLCPDVCPATLADYAAARNRLDKEAPGATDRIETLMVTVDPNRDLERLDGYVTSYVSSAVAAGTDDPDALAAAAEPFGVNYEVRELDDGTVEVDHTPFLYAVDDQGQLLVSWQFGATALDMSNDLQLLLRRIDDRAESGAPAGGSE